MSDDRTITCSVCSARLDGLSDGVPCPSCGSTLRTISVTVQPATLQLRVGIGQAVERDAGFEVTGVGVIKFEGRKGSEKVAERRKFDLEFESGPETWIAMAWRCGSDDLIGMGIGSSKRLAYWAISRDVRDALGND